ncbi:MAG: ATP-dependent DNA helicase DinG [Pseudomonadales bacterium]|nr:ATP-dependent DNA helicase DinG [Pseudomonadales bacterium]
MTETILGPTLKEDIQVAYRSWLGARGFRPRRGQREMIAAIARTLTGAEPRLAVIEAGTGTGKTAAYALAAIPIGAALGKTVVISSATVALQEQVVFRDLPDLKSRSGLEFSFVLAKGRGRYLCLKRLDDRLKYAGAGETPLFETPLSGAAAGDDVQAVYQSMLQSFSDRQWDGELDSWSTPLDADLWRTVTTDHRGCSNNKCSFFKQCPFFKARASLAGCNVIVANHDLVLADLSLGGGAVLPDPEDCIFIIDEAHHLPAKTQQHFSASTRLRSTSAWLDTVSTVFGSMTQRFGRPEALMALATRCAEHQDAGGGELLALSDAVQALPFEPRDDHTACHRFPVGEIPAGLSELAARAYRRFRLLAEDIDRAHEMLQDVVRGELHWERAFEAEDWLPALGTLHARAQATTRLLEDYARASGGSAGPVSGAHARWANRYDEDVELVSAPIQPGTLLQDALWSRCFAAICTSATLTAVGRFDRFLERSGLAAAMTLRIQSPFDFQRIAVLHVPAMKAEPSDFAAHTAEVAERLPDLLGDQHGSLVLFTSWRQMFAVLDMLDEALRAGIKVQGERSKQALLDAHRADVDAGRRSVIFGLASFSEGVDLPDDYCRHVIIVKLPFSVPDDPLDQAMAEWVEAQGRNAFYDISVPDAALRLVQACGRLIRHEQDWGRITLLDRRIVTRRYGRDLLASLPPYRLEVA